ncbi:hypothetical protein Avbf_07143 [Armadillidium vulgare]|nr:hypothetical protein Avbf_07143 [Armadillidium vulgare]
MDLTLPLPPPRLSYAEYQVAKPYFDCERLQEVIRIWRVDYFSVDAINLKYKSLVWWLGPALGGLLAAFTHEYTGARDVRTVQNIGATPRPSIVPRDTSRPSFLSSTPASPTY